MASDHERALDYHTRLVAAARVFSRSFCPLCTVTLRRDPAAPDCNRCRWLLAIGDLTEVVLWSDPDYAPVHRGGETGRWYLLQTTTLHWRALDAVAALLRDRAETRARWLRELRDEQREAQRAARESYHQGQMDQAREGSE